jgi:hypothetical protein
MLLKNRLKRIMNRVCAYENMGDMGGGWGTGRASEDDSGGYGQGSGDGGAMNAYNAQEQGGAQGGTQSDFEGINEEVAQTDTDNRASAVKDAEDGWAGKAGNIASFVVSNAFGGPIGQALSLGSIAYKGLTGKSIGQGIAGTIAGDNYDTKDSAYTQAAAGSSFSTAGVPQKQNIDGLFDGGGGGKSEQMIASQPPTGILATPEVDDVPTPGLLASAKIKSYSRGNKYGLA